MLSWQKEITDKAETDIHTKLGATIISALENKEKLIYLI